MADQGGVSRVQGGAVPSLSGQRSVDGAQGTNGTRSSRAVSSTAGQGVGRREVPEGTRRQLVNYDGQVLNRAAPRGTYLNILV